MFGFFDGEFSLLTTVGDGFRRSKLSRFGPSGAIATVSISQDEQAQDQAIMAASSAGGNPDRILESKAMLECSAHILRPEMFVPRRAGAPRPARVSSRLPERPDSVQFCSSDACLEILDNTGSGRVSGRDRSKLEIREGARQTNYFPPLCAVTSKDLAEQVAGDAWGWADQNRI